MEAAEAALEDAAGAENVQEVREVICVITVIRMVIMQRIALNHQRKESHDFKMADALSATKKDIKKLIVQTEEAVVAAENIGEAEAHPQEEAEAEADPEAAQVLEETNLEDKSKFPFSI